MAVFSKPIRIAVSVVQYTWSPLAETNAQVASPVESGVLEWPVRESAFTVMASGSVQ